MIPVTLVRAGNCREVLQTAMNNNLVRDGLLLGACTLVVLKAWRSLYETPLEDGAKRRRVLAVAVMFTTVDVALLLFLIAELKSVP